VRSAALFTAVTICAYGHIDPIGWLGIGLVAAGVLLLSLKFLNRCARGGTARRPISNRPLPIVHGRAAICQRDMSASALAAHQGEHPMCKMIVTTATFVWVGVYVLLALAAVFDRATSYASGV
jgi:hypothetical protein